MKKQLANLLTCANLFCGCLAVVMIFRNKLDLTAYLVLIAGVCDLLDGMVARKLGTNSPEFGKQIDSLADMVTFGFVPGAIMFKLLQLSSFGLYFENGTLKSIVQFLPFIITIFSAIRLANFNIDTRQSTSFIGLPTPANTLVIISFPLILIQHPGQFDSIILNPWFIIAVSVFMSFMLVAEIPLFSLKFKSLGVEENKFQYALIVCAAILGVVFKFAAIPMIIVLYVFLSVVKNSLSQKDIK